jgi:hypothetical protein
MKEVIESTKQKIVSIEKAIKYLDDCEEFNFESYQECYRIAEVEQKESQLQHMWSQSKFVLPSDGLPGGVSALRQITRDSFVESIEQLQKLVDLMEKM